MWMNWSGGPQARPRATDRPLDEAGVVAAVRRAAARGWRIRPLGAGASWSPVAAAEDVALDCSALTGVVALGGGRVRVRAGETVRDLSLALAGHGLALAAVPAWDLVTVAGATATGTHGSGAAVGSLSAQVQAVRLVDGTGAVRRIEGTDLDAVRTGLGVLGVLTELELDVVPLVTLDAGEALRPTAEVLEEGFLRAHPWAELELYPGGQALARWADPASGEGPAAEVGAAATVRAAAVGSAQALGRVVPRLAPALRRSTSRWSGATTGPAHRILVADRPERVELTEWAIPLDDLDGALRELAAAGAARGVAPRMPLRVRAGAAETGWLHPASGRATAWVAVRAPAGAADPTLFGLVGSVLADAGGRPHWAGRHDWTAAEVEAAYPRFADFRRVRDRLDPDRRFAGPHVDALLGP